MRASMIIAAVAVFVAAVAVLMAASAVLVAALNYNYNGDVFDEHYAVDVYDVGHNVGNMCSSVAPMHRDNCCVNKLMHGIPDPSCPVPPPNVV